MSRMMMNAMKVDSVVAQTVTLSPTAGLSEGHPGHLTPVSVVVELGANAAEFFKVAASGVRYYGDDHNRDLKQGRERR
jgi:hypothetical protein